MSPLHHQIVTSGLSRHLFHTEQWRRAGFAVVMVDNRGSANRGVEFDSAVKVTIIDIIMSEDCCIAQDGPSGGG